MYCCPIDVLVIDHWTRLRRRAMGMTATWRTVVALTPTTMTTTTTMMLTCNYYVMGTPIYSTCMCAFFI